MSPATAILLLWRTTIGLQIGLVGMLVANRLWRSYRRFTAYMVCLTVESGILSLATHPAWLYKRAWTCTRLVLLVLQLLTVIEIYSRWAESHQNIGQFGRNLFLVLMGLAIGLSVALAPVAWSPNGWGLFIYLGLVANGAVQFGAGAFMVLMLLFFAKFGGPVAPNLRRHAYAMTAFSLANTVAYFLFVRRIASVSASIFLQAITVGALLFWILALKRSGEQPPEVKLDPETATLATDGSQQLMDLVATTKQQQERERR